MYFKLSLKNVRKSFKDYSLYFLTLTFGVCIFYVFNSIEAQKAMMNISESTESIMETITKLIGIISIFVSFVLGFLIVYANNFLIKRRKKEIGIYMTLGMEKGKVAKLLVVETFIIGILSLGTGLLTGVFLSQGLSVITAKLFEVDMTRYRFIFSTGAFAKTIIYFGIIFLVVIVMSTISISKYKLIALINAEKQNEKQKLKKPVLTVILFILSIACIALAYILVLKNGLMLFNKTLVFEIILGSIGTFLFFASLSGFFLKLLQSNRRLYFKNLNMFVLRQINSKINTAHISMSVICLMLFFTICILSTGLGMNNALNSSYKYSAPYDASFWVNGNGNISEKLNQFGINLNDYTNNPVQFSLYQYSKQDLTKKIVLGKVEEFIPESSREFNLRAPIYLLKVTDYNKLMKLQQKKEIKLLENQVAIYSDYAESIPALKKALLKFIGMKYPVSISRKDYKVYPEALTDGIITSPASNIMLALVVPDKMVEGSHSFETILSLNYNRGSSSSMQQKLESKLYTLTNKYKYKKEDIRISASTKNTIKSIAAGSKAIISFIGVYLGIIFLITSAAILALQQLSETTDNKRRYDILQKIGADESLVSTALFKQTAIYFLLPLTLAIIHSIVGIKVANDAIDGVGQVNATGNIIITAILITLVYGAYFFATYFSSKEIILKNRA